MFSVPVNPLPKYLAIGAGVIALALGAAAYYFHTQAAMAELRAEALELRATTAETANKSNAQAIDVLAGQLEQWNKLATEATTRERAAAGKFFTFSQTLQDLKKNDAQTSDWARQPLPSAVRGLLEQPRAATTPGDPNGVSAPAQGLPVPALAGAPAHG